MKTTSFGLILTSMMVVELVSGSLQTFLSPLLETLSRTFGVTAAQLNWLSIASLLSSAVCVSILSRLGDMYGHRRVLLWTFGIVMAGSLLVALGRDFELLLVGVTLQGALSGFFPLLVGALRNSGGPESRLTFGIGIMIAALSVGTGVGAVASGLVMEWSDNPTSALWVPAFSVAVAAAAVFFFLPETDHRPGGRVDWLGGALLATGLVGVLLALSQEPTTTTLVYLAGGLLLLAAWAVVELRHPEPMVNVRLFKRSRVRLVSFAAFSFAFALFGLMVANAIFLTLPEEEFGFGFGLSPLHAAFALLPNVAMMTIGALGSPLIVRAVGPRGMLATGSALVAVGYVWTALQHDTLTQYLIGQIVVGLGVGILQQGASTLAVTAVSKDEAAVGSGLNELVFTVGGTVGAAVMASVFAAHTPEGAMIPAESGFTTAWWIAAAVVACSGVLVALLYPARPVTEAGTPA